MLCVGIIGLEPIITGPESVVLPITPYPNFISALVNNPLFSFAVAKVALFFEPPTISPTFFQKIFKLAVFCMVIRINHVSLYHN